MKTPCRTDSPSLGDYLLFIICDWGKQKKKKDRNKLRLDLGIIGIIFIYLLEVRR